VIEKIVDVVKTESTESGQIEAETLESTLKAKEIKPSNRIARKFKKFIKIYINRPDLTPSAIAKMVYNCSTNDSARAIANENLRKLSIGREEILARYGLTDEEDASDLARLRKAKRIQNVNILLKKTPDGKLQVQDTDDFIEVDDNNAQLKALELTYKVKGAFVDKTEAPGDRVNNILTIIENVNVAQITTPGKGISIGREQSSDLAEYLAK